MKHVLEKTIAQHKLPTSFLSTIERWYMPIAEDIAHRAGARTETLIVGVQGCQGSGKSTLSVFLQQLLEQQFNLSTAVLSIDDFYLTKTERLTLSKTVHPLLKTRGVPGTHDIPLAQETIEKLKNLATGVHTSIPRFEKAMDERATYDQWDCVKGRIKVIILEGWCVGLSPQSDEEVNVDINTLESEEDPQHIWRCYVNEALKKDYAELFTQLDLLVVLQAPSFKCVYQWRLLQEEKLIAQLSQAQKDKDRTMSPSEIKHFISHYQRLTEHALNSLPSKSDWLLTLAEDHSITHISQTPREPDAK
ncbi:MAG: phosphoribulokinase [Agarilytica sp.]